MEFQNLNSYRPTDHDLLNYVFYPDHLQPLGIEIIRAVLATDSDLLQYAERLKKDGPPRYSSYVAARNNPLSYQPTPKQSVRVIENQIWLVADFFPSWDMSKIYLRPNKRKDGSYKPLYIMTLGERWENYDDDKIWSVPSIKVRIVDDALDWGGLDVFDLSPQPLKNISLQQLWLVHDPVVSRMSVLRRHYRTLHRDKRIGYWSYLHNQQQRSSMEKTETERYILANHEFLSKSWLN